MNLFYEAVFYRCIYSLSLNIAMSYIREQAIHSIERLQTRYVRMISFSDTHTFGTFMMFEHNIKKGTHETKICKSE